MNSVIQLNKTDLKKLAKEGYQNAQMYYAEEFEEDFKVFNLVKRQIKKHYESVHESNLHLTLNHIITLTNLFNPHTVVRVLYSIINESYHHGLNSFFLFLNILSQDTKKVNIDVEIFNWLRVHIP